MKRIVPGSMLVMILLTLLSTGCAKQPTPDLAAPAPEPAASAPAADVPAAPAPASAAPQADMHAATLERIHFAFDQSTLTPAARDILAANAVILQTGAGLKVGIEGYCDERGSDEYNLALGERRAQAARDYLVSLGVPAERLETISYGEEMPLDSAGGDSAWAKNRRAEFKVLE